ncbi:MAG: response regulator [Anaerolineales bacterium]|nr:response regulator [Anaerolineales bacterium]
MTQHRIFIVEDESIVALDLQNRLRRLGYDIVGSATAGETAVAQAAALKPDLVMMDIQLKGEMDGITAAQTIRSQMDVPIIFLTAYADEATLQRAKQVTPYGYLLKPFQERELHTTISMALYRHEMARKLVESEQWLHTTLDSIVDGVLATDVDGKIRFLNRMASRLTGWSDEMALGREVREVLQMVRTRKRTAEGALDRQLGLEPTAASDHRMLLLTRDGRYVPVEQTFAAIKGKDGRNHGYVFVIRDITRQQQAEETIRAAATELLAQNKELDAFAHTVAHDLRSPLSPILGLVEILEDGFTTMPEEEVRAYLQAISKSSLKMLNIIDELLTLAQLRTEDVSVRELHMADIVAEVQERMKHLLEESGAVMVVPDTWPASVGHAPWVEEVWVNYVSNAIKYGGSPPRIELGATPVGANMVRFWVRDNGKGLAPEDQEKLFTPFTRLHQTRARGSGLGLSIVQRIVSKLGGQVSVESLPGEGSVFSFTLPRQLPPAAGLGDARGLHSPFRNLKAIPV